VSTNNDSLTQRVQSSYRQLAVAATTLNAASDELGKSIEELDSALKNLNLGIPSWVTFSTGDSPDGVYYSYDQVGYAKIGGKWGIAIRSVSGNEYQREHDDVDAWLFNDAPRVLRVQAIGSIPDLLDQLTKDATEATTKVNEKAEQARQLATAINALVEQKPKEAKRSR